VLTEKLGDLNAAVGKPASTLRCYESALELDPSPQQRIRLMLKLGNELMEQKKFKEAADHWMNLYRKFPDYPGRSEIAVKMAVAKAGERADRATNPPAASVNSPTN
jgi:tetratricopeptide (TPR) repeat protein